jgi:hypothetical protein
MSKNIFFYEENIFQIITYRNESRTTGMLIASFLHISTLI